MHRKAEEEAASRANGDDENAARRRPGAEMRSEFLAMDTCVSTRNSVQRFVAGWMHRKAEEEAASSANGDDENAARRRPGVKIYGELLARDK
jgi:hypothetical protein